MHVITLSNTKPWQCTTVGNSSGQCGCPISNSASALSSTNQYNDQGNCDDRSMTSDLKLGMLPTLPPSSSNF